MFQYPQGHPMRFDQGSIMDPEPAAAKAVPSLRFLHVANGQGGSSGGPCFDRSFMLFGMHQGVWSHPAAPGSSPINRGVPITCILKDIRNRSGALPAPNPAELPVWRLSKSDWEAPVIGCEQFQQMAWASALGESIRVILIGGEAGRGKTFRLKLLAAMLPDVGNLKIALEASDIATLDAVALASLICRKAGAAVPAFTPAAEFNSTASVWLRDELADKVMQALAAVRNQRLVWLQFAELNKYDLTGAHAAGLLLTLCEQTNNLPWLRVVLDGMKGALPPGVRQRIATDRAAELTKAELDTYLRRAIAEFQVPVEDTVTVVVNALMRRYNRYLLEDAATAAENLVVEVQDHLAGIMES